METKRPMAKILPSERNINLDVNVSKIVHEFRLLRGWTRLELSAFDHDGRESKGHFTDYVRMLVGGRASCEAVWP